jgi:CDP-diacylglycerol--glycerol-3-phosphate 3-phosphatidyltransferase
MLDTYARKPFDKLFDQAAAGFLALRLSPNHVTGLALAVGLGAGVVRYAGRPVIAVGLLWLSGFLDATDGSMARQTGQASPRGAMFDVVSDRVVELAIFWALALRHPASLYALLGLVSAVLLSMTVFLTTGMLAGKSGGREDSPKNGARRGGGKSFYYQAGLMERTEGFIASTAMMLCQKWLTPLTWIYAGLIGVTICQRLREAARLLKEEKS